MRKFYFLLNFSVLIFFSATAQKFEWAKKAGSTDYDNASAIDRDSFGNLYVTGRFRGIATFGSFILTSKGHEEIFIAKYSPSGEVIWAKRAGGASQDGGIDITVDNNGNIYVVGAFEGKADFGNISFTPLGEGDAFVVKYDTDGNVIWVKQIGGPFPNATEIAFGIAVDPQGNCYVTGTFTNYFIFGNTSVSSQGSGGDMFLVKLDNNGNALWAVNGGGYSNYVGYDSGSEVTVDTEGNCYVLGTFRDDGNFSGITLKSAGINDIFLAKYNSNGTILWVKGLGREGEDGGSSMTIDETDNIYITGIFTSNTQRGGSQSGIMAKYTKDGNQVWFKEVIGNISFNKIKIDPSGNIYTAGAHGRSLNLDGNVLVSRGNDRDIFVGKFDGNGKNIWIASAGSTDESDAALGMALDPLTGHCYVTGEFESIADFSCNTLTSTGASDIFVAKVIPHTTPTPTLQTISGPTIVCQGQADITYSTPGAPNVVKYLWSFPIGTNAEFFITPGNTIVVNYNSNFSGSIVVNGINDCGQVLTSASVEVIVNSLPTTPRKTAGNSTICIEAKRVVYSVAPINNATYQWTLPTGSTLVSQHENSITVDFSDSFTAGTIRVKGENTCGDGNELQIPVSVSPTPADAGAITGLQMVCPEQTNVMYTIPSITGATEYEWILPATITPSSGTILTSSNTIKLNFSSDFTGGDISVKGKNNCKEGKLSQPLSISTPALPANAGIISGPDTVCIGSTKVTYSIPKIAGAISYMWVFPADIRPSFDGFTTGSNQITVNFTQNISSGTVTVTAINVCEQKTHSFPFQLTISEKPEVASGITGPSIICASDQQVEFTATPIVGATSFSWELSPGMRISSGSTITTSNSIKVNIASTAAQETIKVRGINSCGTGEPYNLQVTVHSESSYPTPIITQDCNTLISNSTENNQWLIDGEVIEGATEQTYNANRAGKYTLQVKYPCSILTDTLTVIPVALSTVFIPNVFTPNNDYKNDTFIIDESLVGSTLMVYNRWGKLVYESKTYKNEWMGDNLPTGTYYYLITHKCLEKPIKGWVSLLK